jgi:hypothetical protein
VERVVRPSAALPKATAPLVPPETERRWRARLDSTARVLCALLAASGGATLTRVAMAVGLDATRGALVDALYPVVGGAAGERLSPLAGVIHRLERGIRLM